MRVPIFFLCCVTTFLSNISSLEAAAADGRLETIAIFGATGATGSHVLDLALEQGYKVQALVRSPNKIPKSTRSNSKLTIIEGDIRKHKNKIRQTVTGADYVVCVAGGGPATSESAAYPDGFMTQFVQDIWPIVDAVKPKAFIYQAGAFCPTPDGKLPLTLRLLRQTIARAVGIKPMVDDNTEAMKFMDANPKSETNVIVTRPGRLEEDCGGGKKLVASSSPDMSATCFRDIARFTLEAMKDASLVGKYPFVRKQ